MLFPSSRWAPRWTRFHTKEALLTISGIKADLAVKLFGENFHTLDGIAQQIVRVVSSLRGAADPRKEITSGVAEIVDRAALARCGLKVTDVEQAVASAGSGDVISEVLEGPASKSLSTRSPELR